MTRGKSNKRSLNVTPLSSEKGAIVRKWRDRVPVCVVYPNSYYIGMSNLATHILYRTLNSMPEIVCERCFFEEDGEVRSVESGRPLAAFECIFFSLSFELDFANIPKILNRSVLPALSSERRKGHPIMVAGGICVMANPEPVSSFIDLFIMGDIEATVPSFMNRYLEKRGKERDDLIGDLSSFDWVYNPKMLDASYGGDGTIEAFSPHDFSVTIRRYKGKSLGASAIITGNTEFSDMFLLEGTRGCPSRCPFCLLGNTYPFIYDRLSDVGTDARDIGIIGGGVSFHPHLIDIIQELSKMGKHVHLPSLRIDEVPLPVIELIKDEVKTLTFGIEAGSERLRRFVGKPLADNDIYDKMDAILAIKPFNLKLYFMVGLYGEERSDLEGILEMVKHIKHLMVKKGAKRGVVGTITVHVSPFVPKASTPFQWLPMEDTGTLKDRVAWLKKGLAKVDNTYFTHESVKYSFIQGILARGDRRTGDVVLRFSSGQSYSKVMRENPINLNFYTLRYREKNEQFPWDFITGKTRKERLYTILQSLISGTELRQPYP
ncbi:MAG: Radical SAM superfamily protein [Syntrophorhabdus sp. PtaU1.Bin153]|nr:MAG: Radical SAM superfamily protein [Syntrophorhabdus sp. PtaU1.Bin153]